MGPVAAAVPAIASFATTAAPILSAVSTGIEIVSGIRSLTSKPQASRAPTLTAPTPAVADTPQTTTAQVSQARRDSQDRARAQASAQSAAQQTNLTKGLTKVSDNEEDKPRARRKTFGV